MLNIELPSSRGRRRCCCPAASSAFGCGNFIIGRRRRPPPSALLLHGCHYFPEAGSRKQRTGPPVPIPEGVEAIEEQNAQDVGQNNTTEKWKKYLRIIKA